MYLPLLLRKHAEIVSHTGLGPGAEAVLHPRLEDQCPLEVHGSFFIAFLLLPDSAEVIVALKMQRRFFWGG
jgi:hypothetical protein